MHYSAVEVAGLIFQSIDFNLDNLAVVHQGNVICVNCFTSTRFTLPPKSAQLAQRSMENPLVRQEPHPD